METNHGALAADTYSEDSTPKMADLSNRIDQIEKGFENRQLTKSMMDDSLRFDPDAYLD